MRRDSGSWHAGPRANPWIGLLAVAVSAALMVPMVLSREADANASDPLRGPAGHPSARLAAAPPRGLGQPGVRASIHPLGSPLFYTQIGATLTQVNQSDTITGMQTLMERIPLVTSPYAIGYELNGLSDTGDWYQIVVADNWPGCSAGFEEVTEIWDNQGNTQSPVCDPTLTLSAGDMTQLAITIQSSSNVCLTLTDQRTRLSHQTCVTPPDPGAKVFEFLSTPADFNGYYTGTMTEVVDTSALSCPHDTQMPTVTFDFPPWANITEYVGWSDERDVGGSGTYCYTHSTAVVSLSPGDPTSQFTDSTGSSQYGPHYIEGQNDSLLNSSNSFRFQTDITPLAPGTVNASTLAPVIGQAVSVHATPSGGISPYGKTFWRLNGTLRSLGGAWWNWTANGSGNYTIEASVVDHVGDVSPWSSPLVVRVPYALWAGAVLVGGRSGADVNQTVSFSVRAGGGIGWVSYSWSGLPTGCTSLNASSLTCVPSAPGTSTVVVTIRDSSGAVQASPSLPFTVSTDPSVTVRGDQAIGDVGQTAIFRATVTGGPGGNRFAWQNLLPGCTSLSSTASCAVRVNGNYPVGATFTDSNGYAAQSPSFSFTAFLQPNVTVTADRPIVDLYANLTVTAVVTGGAGGFAYTWTGLPPGCNGGSSSTVRCSPVGEGNTLATVSVLDLANGTATSSAYNIAVVPALEVALTASVKSVVSPGTATFIVGLSGGSQTTTILWHGLPGGCPPTTELTLTCRGMQPGTYSISVTILDVGGGNATGHVQVLVQPASVPTAPTNVTSAPEINVEELALVGVVAVIVLAAVIGAWRVRRR